MCADNVCVFAHDCLFAKTIASGRDLCYNRKNFDWWTTMKKLVIGILAHVDAGKTTLSEAMLYRSGAIRTLGRVDHRDAFLDTDALERERGITIFSKQAMLTLPGCTVTLLDTPGHADFSAEMERTLQVLDYAVLVISGTSGVQGHTHTLWQLLRRYQIPTFLFVNKMDIDGTDRAALLRQLQIELSEGCTDFAAQDESFYEQLALADDDVAERYLETGEVLPEDIRSLIARRRVFPCWFGSALKLTGVDEFLAGLDAYTQEPKRAEQFGARVFKIARDPQGARLTFMKITGGSLRVKSLLSGKGWEEKADQLRVYSGTKFTLTETAEAGMVCAVTGLAHTQPGEGLGVETAQEAPLLQPVLEYRLTPEESIAPQEAFLRLKTLAEEDPQLRPVWDVAHQEIRMQLMGEVQMEILTRVIAERCAMRVSFDEGSIVYKETIADTVEGVGHYEPLRHYAEVHLLLEPGEPGSGLRFDTVCSEDVLARNWQRLILTHLMEKEHLGVLTGAPVTDLRITLLSGRAHLKHTEGGDFRQATYRAVRQGLKKAKSVLLEPWYAFRLELPQENAGRAMTDIQRMGGTFLPPETIDNGLCLLCGGAPVRAMRGYMREVSAYSRGRGRLHCTLSDYRPCAEQETIVRELGYDSERDLENPTGSVFCSHGAGFEVKWDKVDSYAHLPLWSTLRAGAEPGQTSCKRTVERSGGAELDKELLAIFERTYGAVRRQDFFPAQTLRADEKETFLRTLAPAEEYVLVDGYNIIHAWDDLRDIARDNLDAARHILMDMLCNYQGYRGCALILVFDAYRVPQGLGAVEKYHNIHIVYTKEAETADQYIERVTYALGKRRRVRVATSDGLEQLIILGHGAQRISATEFREEVAAVEQAIAKYLAGKG